MGKINGPLIVSACLGGVPCAHDGKPRTSSMVSKLIRKGGVVLVCPEELGGLSTPRSPSEIIGGSGENVLDGKATVLTKDGSNLTPQFLKGAREVSRIAESIGAGRAILRLRSPSCGKGWIYDGTFTGTLREGNGVTAALLLRSGFEVFTEEDLE